MDFLKPKEAKAKLDPRDGWLFKLKSKFTEDEMLFLEEEFDDLECIGMILKTLYQGSMNGPLMSDRFLHKSCLSGVSGSGLKFSSFL